MTQSLQLNPLFVSNLRLTLTLESDGKEKKLPTGNIEKFSLNLHSYGFSSTLQFSTLGNDEIDTIFQSPKALKATLTFEPVDPEQGSDPLLEIKAIVTDRNFTRVPAVAGQEEKAHRSYIIYLCDNAKATWEEHFPSNIYVDESMKDVIEKHVNPETKINYDWNTLEEKHPITAFSLIHKHWLSRNEQESFYSFLMWYLNQENGVLTYDYTQHEYTITGKKKEPSGDPLVIPEWYANPPLCILPEIPRYNSKEIKHSSDTSDEVDKENEHSYKLVQRDEFNSSNYTIYPKHANEKIQSTPTSEKHVVVVELTEFTETIQIDKLIPGSFVSFKGDHEGNWSRDSCFKDKTFRIRSLYFEGNKSSITESDVKDVLAYNLSLKAVLEEQDEPFIDRPKFIPPTFPFYTHGKIFSDIGEEEQTTYKILESKAAPKGQYLALVPLAGKDKKIAVPFLPYSPGQDYYPLYKNTKVMLSMHFRTAKIDETIEWDNLVRLPGGVQGVQTVLASNGKDKYTVLRHEYAEGKNSIFTIQQSSSAEQKQTVQIQEKEIKIFVEEKDKKILTIQLNHDSGFLFSLEDKTAGNTQQIAFDGEKMTHTCKGSAGTSTIVQKPDSIAIECKEFSIKSDTIVLDAKDSISQTGKNNVKIESKVIDAAAPTVKLGG